MMRIRNYRASQVVNLLNGDIDYTISTYPIDKGEYFIYVRPLKKESLTKHRKIGYVVQHRKNEIGKRIEDRVLGWYEIIGSVKVNRAEVLKIMEQHNISSLQINLTDNENKHSTTLFKEDIPRNKEYFYMNFIKEIRLFTHPKKREEFTTKTGKTLNTVKDLQEVKLYE